MLLGKLFSDVVIIGCPITRPSIWSIWSTWCTFFLKLDFLRPGSDETLCIIRITIAHTTANFKDIINDRCLANDLKIFKQNLLSSFYIFQNCFPEDKNLINKSNCIKSVQTLNELMNYWLLIPSSMKFQIEFEIKINCINIYYSFSTFFIIAKRKKIYIN